MPARITGETCTRTDCIAPPHLNGLCYAHWALLSAVEKRTLAWERAALAASIPALEAWWELEPGVSDFEADRRADLAEDARGHELDAA